MASYSNDIKTPLARLAFQHLLKPQTFEDNGNTKQSYGCTLLFSKSADLSELKEAALKAAVDEWGEKAKAMLKDGLIKSPFLDGDGPQGMNKKNGEKHADFEGHVFIRTSANIEHRPKVVDRNVEPIIDPDKIYSGCYVYAVVRCYTWENAKNGRGVSFGISLLQVAKDGERLGGGGMSADKAFDKIADEGEAPAETKTGKGADAFFA